MELNGKSKQEFHLKQSGLWMIAFGNPASESILVWPRQAIRSAAIIT